MNKRRFPNSRVLSCSLATSLMVLSLVACNQDDGIKHGDEAPLKQSKGVESQSAPQIVIDLEHQIAKAKQDLSGRAGVTVDEIKVTQARSVTWGSSAVGCPKKDMNYMQRIVPGVLLILQVDDTIYRYHGQVGNDLFYCPADRATAPAYGQGEELM